MSNSTKTAATPMDSSIGLGAVLKKEAARIKLVDTFLKEKKIAVIISPMYAKYFGNTAQFSIQGIPVFVPCDGQIYMIPKSYAALLFEAVRKVDDQVRKIQRMSNVQQNIEPSIGARNF